MAPEYSRFSPALTSYLFDYSSRVAINPGEKAVSVWEVFEIGHSIQTGVVVEGLDGSKGCEKMLRLHYYADNDEGDVSFPLPVTDDWQERYFEDYLFTDVCRNGENLTLTSLFGYVAEK